jgi:hypothetical protein
LLVGNLLVTLFQALSSNWAQALGTSGLIRVIIGLGVLWAALEYAKRLRSGGLLT